MHAFNLICCRSIGPRSSDLQRVEPFSNYYREKKLAELASIIKGVSYPGISYTGLNTNANVGTQTRTKTKGASSQRKRQFKLKELGKLVRDL
jgi:hypothetical protein